MPDYVKLRISLNEILKFFQRNLRIVFLFHIFILFIVLFSVLNLLYRFIEFETVLLPFFMLVKYGTNHCCYLSYFQIWKNKKKRWRSSKYSGPYLCLYVLNFRKFRLFCSPASCFPILTSFCVSQPNCTSVWQRWKVLIHNPARADLWCFWFF